MIEVDHTNKLTQLFESFWDCKLLNSLDFIWYGNNPVTSDVITKIVKFVGAKALFAVADLKTRLLEAGEHILEDSKMFFPIFFL